MAYQDKKGSSQARCTYVSIRGPIRRAYVTHTKVTWQVRRRYVAYTPDTSHARSG